MARETFADRLRLCMARLGYRQRYVAEQVGVSQPAVAKWLAADTRKVQADVLFRLADLFNVNPRWLSDGQGQPWISPADDWIHESAPESPPPSGDDGAPGAGDGSPALDLLGDAIPEEPRREAAQKKDDGEKDSSCCGKSRCELYACVPTMKLVRGKGGAAPRMVPCASCVDAVIPRTALAGHDPRHCRQFIARTDSMSPTIVPGDAVIVDTAPPDMPYGAVCLLFWQGQSAFARILKKPDGSVLMRFDNPQCPELSFSGEQFGEQIRVIGEVLLRTGAPARR